MPPAVIPYVIAATAVAGTAATVYQGNKAAGQAKKAQAEQSANQQRLESEVNARAAGAESEANAIATRDAAKRRQQNLAVGAGGRQDTILTGPQGDISSAPGAKKTLLGT